MSYALGYSGGYLDAGTVGTAASPSPFRVEVDWDKDGDFLDPGEDVTALVRPLVAPVAAQYGRDQSTALAPSVSGQGSFTLDNRDRRFSPRNKTSPLYGKVKPARPVRITRELGGTSYVLFRGFTDDTPINPDLNSRTVNVTLVDALAVLRGQNISTAVHSGLRTGEAIGLVLDAAGWPANLRDLDAGATVIPWWWEDGIDALAAIEKIVRSEGPPALFTVGSAGEVIFRDRHHRLTSAPSLTSQGTWRGVDGVEPVMSVPFTYDESWRNIINTGTLTVERRHPQARQVVWSSESTISLSPGEQQILTASGSDPFIRAVTPEQDTDYTATKGSVEIVLLRDSGSAVGMSITAIGGDAIIDGLQLRAQPLTVVTSTQVSASDAGSVSDYGPRGFPGDLPWCGAGDAHAVLTSTIAQRSEPLPVLSVRFVIGRNTDRAAAVLRRDLSDRVTVHPTSLLSRGATCPTGSPWSSLRPLSTMTSSSSRSSTTSPASTTTP